MTVTRTSPNTAPPDPVHAVGLPAGVAADAPLVGDTPRRSRWTTLRHFIVDEPLVVVALLILVVVTVFALFPGLVASEGPNTANLMDARQAPSAEHFFGTDQIGRDVFSRVVYGTRVSLEVGLFATLLAAFIGCSIGLTAGYLSGWVDSVLMRLIDVLLAFPGILLALAIIAVRGVGLANMIFAIAIAGIPGYARVIRGEVIAVKARPFIEAAQSTGLTRRSLVLRHILPNALAPVTVLATVGIGFAVLAGSSLSFLGLGLKPPSPEWGAILSDGRSSLQDAWWIAVFPGLAILFTVVAVNVVGQWLRERLDVRTR